MARGPTVGVLALSVSVLTVALTWAGLALAEVEPPGTPAVEPPAEESRAAPDDAPDASVAGRRTWLSERSVPTATAPQGTGISGSTAVLSLFLAAGGGAAFWYQRRRSRTLPTQVLSVKVLGSAKVGPRAHVVVTSVGEHVLLLGVTDGSVRRLAWLSEPRTEDTRASDSPFLGADLPGDGPSAVRIEQLLDQRLELRAEPTPRGVEIETRRRESPASRQKLNPLLDRAPVEMVLPDRGHSERADHPATASEPKSGSQGRSFRELVLKALSDGPAVASPARRPAAPNKSPRRRDMTAPAELIAEETRDVVQTGRTLQIEGQAAGLAARLQARG